MAVFSCLSNSTYVCKKQKKLNIILFFRILKQLKRAHIYKFKISLLFVLVILLYHLLNVSTATFAMVLKLVVIIDGKGIAINKNIRSFNNLNMLYLVQNHQCLNYMFKSILQWNDETLFRLIKEGVNNYVLIKREHRDLSLYHNECNYCLRTIEHTL